MNDFQIRVEDQLASFAQSATPFRFFGIQEKIVIHHSCLLYSLSFYHQKSSVNPIHLHGPSDIGYMCFVDPGLLAKPFDEAAEIRQDQQVIESPFHKIKAGYLGA